MRRAAAALAAAILMAGAAPAQAAAPGVAPGAAPNVAPEVAARVPALIPALQRYVKAAMTGFDVPGAAVGIVAGDRLVYAQGFGVRRKGGSQPVDSGTVFQIGSTTKAFLATTLAIAVDRGKLQWDDRVVDRDPAFMLKDPHVTREFRVYDLLAQRSGLPPYANDWLSGLGFDAAWLMHSLRYVEPAASFRSTFAYTNITHLFGGRVATKALGAADWPALARREIIAPLGMRDASFTPQAIEAAADHATGHRWTPQGTIAVPFDATAPYIFGPAGDINASLADCARWLALQIGDGVFAGHRLVSAKNLAVTRMARVAVSDKASYAMGWIRSDTANGRIIWHNGGTNGFNAHIGFLPDKGVGVIVLSNEDNKGFADAVAMWAYDRLLGNPETDYARERLAKVKREAAEEAARYRRPATAAPTPDLAALAGDYTSDELGPAHVTREASRLVLALKTTGARIDLDPFDGAVFSLRLVPEGRFARIAELDGDEPFGFAGFEADDEGRLTRLALTTNHQRVVLKKAQAAKPPPAAGPVDRPAD